MARQKDTQDAFKNPPAPPSKKKIVWLKTKQQSRQLVKLTVKLRGSSFKALIFKKC